MGYSPNQTAYAKTDHSNRNPSWFTDSLSASEVTDRYHDDQRTNVVGRCNDSRLCRFETESPLNWRDDHIDKTIDAQTLYQSTK